MGQREPFQDSAYQVHTAYQVMKESSLRNRKQIRWSPSLPQFTAWQFPGSEIGREIPGRSITFPEFKRQGWESRETKAAGVHMRVPVIATVLLKYSA